MKFLGIDTELMYDIVVYAAGAGRVLKDIFDG